MKQADIRYINNRFVLSGELDCFNVMKIYQLSEPYLRKASQLEFDFSAVTSSDSAGIALLIEWIKYAKRYAKPIKFINLANSISQLAQAVGLSSMIGEGR